MRGNVRASILSCLAILGMVYAVGLQIHGGGRLTIDDIYNRALQFMTQDLKLKPIKCVAPTPKDARTTCYASDQTAEEFAASVNQLTGTNKPLMAISGWGDDYGVLGGEFRFFGDTRFGFGLSYNRGGPQSSTEDDPGMRGHLGRVHLVFYEEK